MYGAAPYLILSCSHCTIPCGAQASSLLRVHTCVAGANIANSAGALTCSTATQDLPAGKYQESCSGCSLNTRTRILTCKQCPRDDASLNRNVHIFAGGCTNFTNTNGQLSCVRPGGAHRESVSTSNHRPSNPVLSSMRHAAAEDRTPHHDKGEL